MFYKLLAGGVLATFGGVFWLAAPSSGPAASPAPAAPEGLIVARPVGDVYSAIRNMPSPYTTPDKIGRATAGFEVPNIAVVRVPDVSLMWKYRAGSHRMLDLKVMLVPTADGTSTVLQLATENYPLPASAKIDDYAMRAAAELPSRFGYDLGKEIEEIDPEAATRIKRASLGPAFARGAMMALRVAANPIAVMKQAKQMENDIRAMDDEDKAARLKAAERARYVDPNISYRPGQPMLNPSNPPAN